MPEPTAAERAADVLAAAYVSFVTDDNFGTFEDCQAAALMADPGLLVDLAIEAGALVETPGVAMLYRRQEDDS